MNLNQPNRQKLYIRRAILWANVYHSTVDSFKGSVSVSQVDLHYKALSAADQASKAFDARFEFEPNQKPCAEKAKPETPPTAEDHAKRQDAPKVSEK